MTGSSLAHRSREVISIINNKSVQTGQPEEKKRHREKNYVA